MTYHGFDSTVRPKVGGRSRPPSEPERVPGQRPAPGKADERHVSRGEEHPLATPERDHSQPAEHRPRGEEQRGAGQQQDPEQRSPVSEPGR